MSNLETPSLPGRAPGAAGAATTKDPKARLAAGGRDERGSAFRALLQNLDKGTGRAASAAVGKGEDASPTENKQTAEATAALALDALVPAAQPEPVAGATDAARLLLGALQTPAREPQPESRKEPGTKRDAFAALSSALAKAGTGTPPDNAASAMKPLVPEAGIAMPSDTTAPVALSDLAELADPTRDAPGKSEAIANDAAPEKPMTITVVRQETHLPPVMRLSPLQQVAEPIRQATAELSLARSEAVLDLPSDKPAGIAEPTKILHLQLSPVELGSITVKLRISQGGMEIRLEASRAETAQMLANDREALREIVKASGYALDQVSVETVHVDAAAPDPRPGGQEATARDGAADERSGARDGRGFDQSRQGDERKPPRHGWQPDATTSTEEPHDQRESNHPGRDLYRYL